MPALDSSVLMGLSVGVARVVASIVGGWYYHYRYPVGITFFKERCIGLFEAVVQNLPELEILYQKDALLQNTKVLLKGFFLNTGTKAIEPSMVEENLTLTLPEGFRWLTGKIVSAPSKMAQVKMDGQHLVFELGLFQRREVIHFVALAEVPLQPHLDAGKTVEEKMRFTLRIADSSPVKTRDVPTSDRFKFLKRQLIAPAVVFVVIYSLFFGSMFLLPSYEKLQYSMVLDESTSIDVTPFLKKDGTIEVKDASGSVVKTFPYETFRHEPTIEARLVTQKPEFFSPFSVLVASIYALLTPIALMAYPL